MTVQFTQLPQGFGAEVTGFDPREGRDAADIAALQAAFAAHHMLIFRDCGRLSPKRQAEIVGWFGRVGVDAGPDGDPTTRMDNADSAGRSKLLFHSDITYMEHPLQGISLHPLELPSRDTSTTFISNAVAWDTLPAELQQDLRPRKARHYYKSGHEMGYDWPVFEHWHPVCMPHYRTGRELLFVTEHHADRIEGYGEAQGAALLQKLFAHVYAPARQYDHVWRMGDLVVWDNYAIQHARKREAVLSEGKRILQRVWFGERGFAEQLEVAKKKAKERAA